MHRRLTLSLAMAAIGVGLLVASSFAGAASASSQRAGSGEAKRGGTLRLNVSNTDFEFTDPAMAYDAIGWQMLYAVNITLLNYPDKPAPEGTRLVPEAAAGFPRVSRDGKTYTFTVRSGLKFSDGSRRHRRCVQARDRARSRPAAGLARDRVPARRRRRRRAQPGQGPLRQRRHRQRPDARGQAPAGEPDVPRRAGDAVLRRRQADHGDRPEGHLGLPVGRPVPDRQPHDRAVADAGAEPELQGLPPGERRPDRLHGQHGPEPEPAPGPRRPGGLRRLGRPADRARRPRAAVRRQEGRRRPLLRQLVHGRRLRGAEHVTGAVQPGQHPQGGELRDRPPGDGARLRQVLRQADGSDPAAEPAGLPRGEPVPDQGRRPGEGPPAERRRREHGHDHPLDHRSAHGAGPGAQVQPRADGAEGGDEAAAVRGRPPHGRHPRRRLRRLRRRLGGRLPGPVRLHQRPPGRQQHPGVEQQQLRVLQRRPLQQADERLREAVGPEPLRVVRQARRRHHAERGPVGAVRDPELARVRVAPASPTTSTTRSTPARSSTRSRSSRPTAARAGRSGAPPGLVPRPAKGPTCSST